MTQKSHPICVVNMLGSNNWVRGVFSIATLRSLPPRRGQIKKGYWSGIGQRRGGVRHSLWQAQYRSVILGPWFVW